jgi:rare lipoprotein A
VRALGAACVLLAAAALLACAQVPGGLREPLAGSSPIATQPAAGDLRSAARVERAAASATEPLADADGTEPPAVAEPAQATAQMKVLGQGLASWYGARFHGRRTASGERYDRHAFTAAHRTLPFGTVVRVRMLQGGRTVDVRINDRGPRAARRIIDLSEAAAFALGLQTQGVQAVEIAVLSQPQEDTGAARVPQP